MKAGENRLALSALRLDRLRMNGAMIVSISNYKRTLSPMSGSNDDPAALRRRRRSWALDEKRRIVDESLADGASIAEVARRYDLNANQLFTWRRQFGVEPAALQELAPILPVTITPDDDGGIFRPQRRPARWRSCSPRGIGSSCGPMSRQPRCRGS